MAIQIPVVHAAADPRDRRRIDPARAGCEWRAVPPHREPFSSGQLSNDCFMVTTRDKRGTFLQSRPVGVSGPASCREYCTWRQPGRGRKAGKVGVLVLPARSGGSSRPDRQSQKSFSERLT